MNTKSILAELEDLGATGNAPVELPKVEAVKRPTLTPAPVLLDDRGAKMARLADIVIGELDTLVVAASTMRDALSEMKDMWTPEGTEEASEDLQEALDALNDPEELYDDEEVVSEIDVVEEEENFQGSPNAMGNISLSVPPPVPLPSHIADLPD